MKRIAPYFTGLLLAIASTIVAAHHSFAIYDFATEIEFEGVVEKLTFRNPHMAMVLKIKDSSGAEKTINFVEGAPANMLLRMGLKPDMMQVGTHLKAIGSPRNDDPDAYFLKVVILDDGQTFRSVGKNQDR
ncbi:MAG: hypothetical protein H6978_04800 [Gammaproteobacteria bacterium]|nr:hypothetical protein [Gammaproteobacteria bacterium]